MNPTLSRLVLMVMAVSACGGGLDVVPDAPRPTKADAVDSAPSPAETADLRRDVPADVVQRGGAPVPFPDWLHGTMWRRDDGVPQDVRQVIFWPGHYAWWVGPRTEMAGDLVMLSTDHAALTGGPLAGQSLDLGRVFSASCRVLHIDGRTLWSDWEVPGCPWARQLSPAECAQVGGYSQKYSTGGFDAAGDGTVTSHVETMRLERDGFFLRTHETVETTCSGGTCADVVATRPIEVGEWDGGTDLSSWQFLASNVSCP